MGKEGLDQFSSLVGSEKFDLSKIKVLMASKMFGASTTTQRIRRCITGDNFDVLDLFTSGVGKMLLIAQHVRVLSTFDVIWAFLWQYKDPHWKIKFIPYVCHIQSKVNGTTGRLP